MAMMRRGPLDRYPVDWVLRQADLGRITGAIEVHADRTITLYLDGGRIYGCDADDGLDAPDDEEQARAIAVAALASVVDASSGWYYHDPLGHQPGAGTWSWDPTELLAAARAGRSRPAAAPPATSTAELPPPPGSAAPPPPAPHPPVRAPGADRQVALTDPANGGVRLSADAWTAIVALAADAGEEQLAGALGWEQSRLTGVLHELVDQGLARLSPRVDAGTDQPAEAIADDDRVVPFRPPSGRSSALRRRRQPTADPAET
jgi:hypothetical protein